LQEEKSTNEWKDKFNAHLQELIDHPVMSTQEAFDHLTSSQAAELRAMADPDYYNPALVYDYDPRELPWPSSPPRSFPSQGASYRGSSQQRSLEPAQQHPESPETKQVFGPPTQFMAVYDELQEIRSLLAISEERRVAATYNLMMVIRRLSEVQECHEKKIIDLLESILKASRSCSNSNEST
jgi:hypothetical protein